MKEKTQKPRSALELFVIRDGRSGPVIKDAGSFNDKMKAKKARDQHGPNAVVSYGPDHKLYNQI